MDNNSNRMQELIDSCLNDAAVNEYDALIAKYKRRRIFTHAAAGTAAGLALFFMGGMVWNMVESRLPSEISSVEIFETLDSIAELGMDEINVLTIEPRRHSAVITAEFKDGTVKEYLLKQGEDGSSLEMTALNKQ